MTDSFAPESVKDPNQNVKNVPKIEDLKDPLTLKFVFVVMRNGESFPDEHMIKTNPSYEWKHYKFPRGELTKLGRLTMYEAGENLRHWYPEFLSRSYVTKRLVKVTAVGSKFTINSRESALIVRAALRQKNKKHSLKRKWSTRKLASTRNDEFTDAALDYYLKCKEYRPAQNKALYDSLITKFKNDSGFGGLWKALQENTEADLDYNNLSKLQYLFELYETSELSGIGFPHWLHNNKWYTYYELMREYVNASYSTDYLKTVAGGRMLQYFVEWTTSLMENWNLAIHEC
ncbi:uncharacterized protein LOC113385852 [Ctenocephalides felis]|uniref:uncharacterized protein LOC113385852 n=1 Tax=Ctenocephalides felis TaxID=7515 RepID=UPI000E6E5123|nr:uncharacterized protein LOC113385852 [Ctenocephalides felis]